MPDTSSNTQAANKRQKRFRHSKIPWILKWLRWSFAVLNVVSPSLGARRAYRLWFTSPRFAEPAREQRWRQSAQAFYVEHGAGPLAAYRWGQGPTVLLVHGWSGRGTQMGAFVSPLVKHGFSVVAFDAPGHGRSPGSQTNAFEVADALMAVAKATGPVKAVVAHSFGTMATTLAMKQGLSVEKVVCLSAPVSGFYLVEKFCHSLSLSRRTEQLLKQRLENNFGPDIWQRIASDVHVANCTVPALIIHDKDDLDVPWQKSEQLAKTWPGSYFWLTRGLGHRRILRSAPVIDSVGFYIAEDRIPTEAVNAKVASKS